MVQTAVVNEITRRVVANSGPKLKTLAAHF